MNVLLISQCNKRALTETRRVLDQFAERRGDRTWQTAITLEGLKTLRKLLRKTARKNTAVACHWIRGKDHSELIWIVGNAHKFNEMGVVPVHSTSRNILKSEDEDNWSTAETIALLAGIAGLFHDFGKANTLFQAKLQPKYSGLWSEPVRHEWVSLRLFGAFVGDMGERDWLAKLAHVSPGDEKEMLQGLVADGPKTAKNPFRGIADRPVATLVAWLIVSHHRLPTFSRGTDSDLVPRSDEIDEWLLFDLDASWNSPQFFNPQWSAKEWKSVWRFPHGTPVQSDSWCAKAQSLARRALAYSSLFEARGLQDRSNAHLARMVLMLADHSYSAMPPTLKWQDAKYAAYANTDRATGHLKQQLDEHNVGVGHHAFLIAKHLPKLRSTLPALTRVKTLKQRVKVDRFRWQDKAYDIAVGLSLQSESQGFFGVNMASTGCGKTFGNARIMYGLANEKQGCRFSVALGLRVLTLQTGAAFREKLRLDEDDMAELVGSQSIRQLHTQAMRKNDDPDINERAGSESLEDLVDPGQHVRYEGTIVDGPIGNWLAGAPKAKQLVSAPVLVSTIDYLMPATEGTRGGRQIAPMLRLLSSDLVLDEPDDFALEDLPALCRLVNWAGMLGSRVLLSSATLAPALVHALFAAYLEGRRLFDASKARQASTRVSCAWFDEFGATHSIHDRPSTFSEAHSGFVSVRIRYLKKQLLPLRRARLQTIDSSSQAKEDVTAAFAQVCHEQLYELHTCHATASLLDPQKTVSFGLIRMANIEPLIDVAKLLLSKAPPQRHRLHFCVYHSQYPLILRSNIESTLDRVLNRTSPDAIWDAPTVKNALLKYPEDHHVFVVLGTSVTEVGRDHDYDWAIVEPSSMRSLVQLAGRIQRHRQQVPEHANLAILTRNVKGLSGAPVAFTRPGFESKDFCLASKDLRNILLSEQFTQLNAVPRISPRSELDYRNNLVDLEHVHLQARLFGGSGTPFNASLWWEHESSWCGELQRRTPFRRSTPDEEFVLYREDETDEFTFVQVLPNSGQLQNVQLSRFANYELTINERVSPWINQDVPELIEGLSETTGWSHANCCLRFASVRLREGGRWRFSPQLGIHSMP